MSDFRLWECLVCGFIYDETKGWPEDGIAPGTRWEDVPEDWLCPECGVGKSDFQMVDIGPSPSISANVAANTVSEPKPAAKPPIATKPAATSAVNKTVDQQWQCHECDFIYAEKEGWLEDGLAPGTAWQNIPADWSCPDCGAEQSAFVPLVNITSDNIVVIGTGLAAYNFVREFRKQEKQQNKSQATPITMITSDDGHFYPKPQISTGYTKQKRADELVTAPAEQMAIDLQIDIRVFTKVTEINTQAQFVVANGQHFNYGKLVLAWGASCISPPMQGNGLSEVYQVNDLLDYNRFRTALVGKRKVLVIGAGLIGSEYSNDLSNGGYEIEAVDPLAGPLATLLPEAASQAVQRGLESLGVKYHFGTVAERIDKQSEGQGIRATLANGEVIDADIVLSAVGVRPRVQLAQAAGIETNRGIVVNRQLETSAANVYALGDCAEVDGHVLYYLLPLMACARSLASTISGTPSQVSYGAMPVKVKTPVCPLTVLPPPMGVEGDWTVEQKGNDTKALFHDKRNTLRGFALTGEHSSEATSLAAEIPALME